MANTEIFPGEWRTEFWPVEYGIPLFNDLEFKCLSDT